MTSAAHETTSEVTGRGVGIAALVLAIATPVSATAGWIVTALTPGPGALGVGILALVVVAAIAVIAVVVAVISLVVSTPNIVAKLSLVLVGASAIVLFLMLFPPNQWFGA